MTTFLRLLCLHIAFICICSYAIPAENPIIIDDIIVTEEICELNNGSLTIIISGNYTDLIYSIDNGLTFQSSNYFGNLGSGDYIALVSDANSCSETFSIQIVDAPLPQVNIDFECELNKNRINVNLAPFSNGIQPFTYHWSGPNGTSYDSQNLDQVVPGVYFVTVTDRIGCAIDTTITLPVCCELIVKCREPDTTYLNCISEVSEINPLFLDNNTDNDLNELTRLGVNVIEKCSDISVTVSDEYDASQECGTNPLLYTRVYQIDDGSNLSTCEKVLIIDNYGDILLQTAPEDLQISCDKNIDDILSNWIDNIAGASIKTCSGTYEVKTVPDLLEISYTCVGTGDLEIEFIITDECDNELRFTSEFSVNDITPPNITCPSMIDITADQFDFDQQVNAWLETYSSIDNCSNVTVTNDYNIDNLTYECAEENLDVEFVAVDDCGNQNQCVTSILISQIFVPTIECPEALVIQCDGNNNDFIVGEWIGLASAGGYNNIPIGIGNDFNILDLQGLACLAPAPVRFFADRACLQDVECFTTIELVDLVAPIISCPPSLVLENGDVAYESKIITWLSDASATDNCGQASVSNGYRSSDLDFCNNDGALNVEFFAFDDCDNISTCESMIELTPYNFSIQCPDDIVIDCNEQVDLMIEQWLLKGIGIENFSDSLLLDNDFILSNLNTTCDGITEVKFSTNNVCQGLVACTSSIKIVDKVAPIITCPQAITVSIDSNTKEEEISLFMDSAIAIDDCHDVTIVSDLQSEIADVVCSEDFAILFTATDECDNISECSSQLTLVNNSSPEMICPDIFSAYCSDKLLDEKIISHLSNVEVTASVAYDIYNDLDFSIIDRDCEQDYLTEVLIGVIDDCGNESSCSTILHIYPPPRVYIPNIITPESNKSDEIFTVFSNNSVIEVSSLRVYDRWGSLIFEGQNFPPNDMNYGWDGVFNNLVEKSNVMTYHVIVEGILGDELEFAGTIQVMK